MWHSSICYSNAHGLNGRIEKDVIGALYPPLNSKAAKLAPILVRVGLWHDRGDYYEIHDYEQYQEQALKESVEARREYERERKRSQRANAKPGQGNGHVPDNVPDTGEPVPSVTRAFPARPGPARPEEAADAASGAAAADLPIDARELAQNWHAVLNGPGGCPGLVHAEHSWRPDYETVAAALNALGSPNNRVAMIALLRWFWNAPDGPIQSGRIKRINANPSHLAKRISTDLRAADAWYRSQPEQEAAQ